MVRKIINGKKYLLLHDNPLNNRLRRVLYSEMLQTKSKRENQTKTFLYDVHNLVAIQ